MHMCGSNHTHSLMSLVFLACEHLFRLKTALCTRKRVVAYPVSTKTVLIPSMPVCFYLNVFTISCLIFTKVYILHSTNAQPKMGWYEVHCRSSSDYFDAQCTVVMNGFFSPLAACSYIVLHEQPQTLHTSNQEHLMTLLARSAPLHLMLWCVML